MNHNTATMAQSHPCAYAFTVTFAFILVSVLAVASLLVFPRPAVAAEEAEDLSETAARYFCAYKPNYFILGVADKGRTNPTTKFEFSFQTMLFDLSKPGETPNDSCAKPSGNHLVHFGYTHKSI